VFLCTNCTKQYIMGQEETICAISTPPGSGEVAMIRVSGKEAMDICNKAIRFPDSDKQLKRQQAGTIHYAGLFDGEQQIDEVMVSIFKAPRSYTGEDVVEITCHGSLYIQQRILNRKAFGRPGPENSC